MEKNLYEILGVEKTASEEEIEKAFKNSAKFFHPDMHPTANADTKVILEDMFKEINHAYSVLSDKEQRAEYDCDLKAQEELAKKDCDKKEHITISSVFKSIVTDIKEEFEEALATKPTIEAQQEEVPEEEIYQEYSEEREEDEQARLFKLNIKNIRLMTLVLAGAIAITTLACHIVTKDEPLESTTSYSDTLNDDTIVGGNYIDNGTFTSDKITLTRFYRVEEGDTLEALAEQAGTTTAAIKKRNNISEDTPLEVGSVLTISYCYNINDIPYFTDSVTCDENDTVEDVADKYNTTRYDLLKLNPEAINPDGDILSTTLKVPNFIPPIVASVESLAEANGYQYSYGQ